MMAVEGMLAEDTTLAPVEHMQLSIPTNSGVRDQNKELLRLRESPGSRLK